MFSFQWNYEVFNIIFISTEGNNLRRNQRVQIGSARFEMSVKPIKTLGSWSYIQYKMLQDHIPWVLSNFELVVNLALLICTVGVGVGKH